MSLETVRIFMSTQFRRIPGVVETADQACASKKRRGHPLLNLLITLVFVPAIYPSTAHAQIVGDLEVNIPFLFHGGNTNRPPGRYTIHNLDDGDNTVVEISSADDSISALFEVQVEQANDAPAKSEVVFNKYGDRYFLAQLIQEGNPSSSKVV